MKTTKTIARIAGVVLAGMMALSFASCNEKNGGAAAAGADGLTKAQQNLLKEKPASESDFEIELSYDGSYVKITGYKGKGVKTLVYPATIEGMPVKEILDLSETDRSDQNKKVKTMVIPEGVEYVRAWDYDNLETVVLPSTIKGIGRFGRCPKLSSINLPEGLVAIDRDAFCETALKSVTLPKSLKFLGGGAFRECDELSEINIPDGLSVLGGTEAATGRLMYSNGTLELYEARGDVRGSDFSSFFYGKKINESVALQKLLKETKTVEVKNMRKYDEKPYTSWDW